MTEREILKQEELDFGRIFNRIFRAWPVILISLAFFLFLAALFIVIVPPSYTARTSFLVEKPLGVSDPSTLISHYPAYKAIDDYYYKNQKLSFKAYPFVKQTIEDLGLRFTYLKAGIIDQDIYENSPFHLEVNEDFYERPSSELPLGAPFYVDFKNENTYEIRVEGEYPVTEKEYFFEGSFGFGEWVNFDRFKFRLILDIDLTGNEEMDAVYTDNTFGFKLNDPDALTLELMEGFELLQEEVDATVIGVSTTASTQSKAKDILTKLGEVYISNQMADKTEVFDKAVSFLDDEIEANMDQLKIIEQDIEDYKVDNGITGLNEMGLLVSKESMDLENQKVSILLKQKYYAYLENYLTENDIYSDLISPNAFGVKDPLIADLTTSLVQLSNEKASLEATGTQANPLYNRLTSRMEADKKTIQRTIEGFNRSNEIALEQVDGRIRKIQGDIRDLPRVQNRLQQMERLYRIHEHMYKTLRENRSSVALSRVSVAPDVKILEPAYLISLKPTFPNPLIIVVIAILLGLVLPILWILGKSLFSNKLDDIGELAGVGLSVPLLGELTNTGISKGTELQSYPGSKLGQEVEYLLKKVEASSGNTNCISVTSGAAAEGKTFVSSMMAVRLARNGERVLLIDSNLVSPHLHEHFGRRLGTGLTEVMSGNVTLEEAIQNTSVEGVELLSAGTKNSYRDWDEDAFSRLIADARSKYDRVIIDTAPFAEVSEIMDVLASSGFVIIVVRRGVSKRKEIEDIEDLKSSAMGLPAMGLIMTDSFEDEVTWNLFKKDSKYYSEKPISLASKVRRLFKKV
jgi:capsular exopolysaccharide synthesis family protein